MNPDPVAPPTARDYFRILARRWWVVVLGIVGFALIGVAYAKQYISSVAAQQAALTKRQTASILSQLQAQQRRITTLQNQVNAEAKNVDTLDRAAIAAGQVPLRGSSLLTALQDDLNNAQ